MKVRFSVVIPAHNRGTYVRQAIDSVLSQTFTDYELIAVDDGSTDDTPRVLQSYGSRIRAIRQVSMGPEAARNRGAAAAQGDYIVFLDDDDLLLPHALATYDRILQSLDSPPLVIGLVSWFKGDDIDGLEVGDAEVAEVCVFRDYLSKRVPVGISNSIIVIRTSVFHESGGYRAGSFPLDDFDLMLRVGTCDTCAIVQRPATVAYRCHDGNHHRRIEPTAKAIFRLIEAEKRGEYPGSLKRRVDRYAYIGGMAWQWIKASLKHRRPDIGLKLLARSQVMIAAGAARRLWQWRLGPVASQTFRVREERSFVATTNRLRVKAA